MSLPMALIIISGEIDLSVESMVGLSAAVLGFLWAAGVPIGSPSRSCSCVGALGGLLNGVLVTRMRPAVAGRHARDAGPVPRPRPGRPRVARRQRLPAMVHDASGSGTCPGPPSRGRSWSSWRWPSSSAVVLHRTWVGRQIYAIGKNAAAAALLRRPRRPHQAGLFVLVRHRRRARRRDPHLAPVQRPRRRRHGHDARSWSRSCCWAGVDIFGGRGHDPRRRPRLLHARGA